MPRLCRHVQDRDVTGHVTTAAASAHAQRGSPRDVTSGGNEQLDNVTVSLLSGEEDGRHSARAWQIDVALAGF